MMKRDVPRRRMHLLRLAWVAMLAALSLLGDPRATASIAPLREVSYYPRNYAWLEFWSNWDDARDEMASDLDLIWDLGANTVRFFVHPDAFSYSDPTQIQHTSFEEALLLIDTHGLWAHVNLFDCWWSRDEIEASRAWMEAFVAPYAGDPRIAVWELQNEVDLADPVARAWVQALLPELKRLTGGTPVTVSLLDVEQLDELEALGPPDLYSLHRYPTSFVSWTSDLAPTLQRAKELVSVDRLLLGEFGYDSYRVSEETQAALYRDVLHTAHQAGIVHLGQWTFYDFPKGTAQCDRGTPAAEPELHFGVYRLDGTPKPAAQVLREAYHDWPPSLLSPSIISNGSFEAPGYPCGPANWYPWDEGWSSTCWHEQDCSVAHTGSCSARVSRMPSMTVGLYNVPALRVEGGKRYSLEGYARAESLAGEAWIAFSCFDEYEVWLDQDVRSVPLTSSDGQGWTRLHIDRAQLPTEAAFCQVYAQVYSSDPATIVWFDDLTTIVERAHLPLVMR